MFNRSINQGKILNHKKEISIFPYYLGLWQIGLLICIVGGFDDDN